MSTTRSGVSGGHAQPGATAWRRIAVAAVFAVTVAGCSSSVVTPYPAPSETVAAATATSSATATPTAEATPAATDTSATDTSSPAPSPTETAAPKVTPTPLPALAIGLCTGAQLRLSIEDWEGDGSNSSYSHIVATNVSSAGCNMRGTPRTQILDSHGSVIADSGSGGSEIKTTDPVYPVAPNGQIRTIITWSNWCKAKPSQPYASAAVLPFGLGRIAAKAYTAKTTLPAGCYSSGTATTVSAEAWAP